VESAQAAAVFLLIATVAVGGGEQLGQRDLRGQAEANLLVVQLVDEVDQAQGHSLIVDRPQAVNVQRLEFDRDLRVMNGVDALQLLGQVRPGHADAIGLTVRRRTKRREIVPLAMAVILAVNRHHLERARNIADVALEGLSREPTLAQIGRQRIGRRHHMGVAPLEHVPQEHRGHPRLRHVVELELVDA